MKDSTWLKLLGHSNLFYARATRAITNHTPIDEYGLRFFPKENFNYPCRLYPIKLRCYILHEYKIFNNYWNSNREFLSYFVMFLEFNPNVFSFHKEIT